LDKMIASKTVDQIPVSFQVHMYDLKFLFKEN